MKKLLTVVLGLLFITLVSCGGGGGNGGITPASYLVGGSVSGLVSAQQKLVLGLTVNGAKFSQTSVAGPSYSGNFQFGKAVPAGSTYAVLVLLQPSGATCTVNNPSAAGINANVTNIQVVCSDQSFTLGGSVSGIVANLQPITITLNANKLNSVTMSTNGTFTFPSPLTYDSIYSVTVDNVPGETCSVNSAYTGQVVSNINDIQIVCSPQSFKISGFVSGLISGQTLTLINKDNTNYPTPVYGQPGDESIPFTISNLVTAGSYYDLKVSTQPQNQICSFVSGKKGGPVTADINNVQILCSTKAYNVTTTVTGLSSGHKVAIELNGTLPASITSNTDGYTFPESVADGAPYNVTIDESATAILNPGGYCVVNHGDGTITGNVNNVVVNCAVESGNLIPTGSSYTQSDGKAVAIATAEINSKQYLYVDAGNNIYAYSIGAHGSLTALANSPFSISGNEDIPFGAMNVVGNMLYIVGNTQYAENLLGYIINSDGSLKQYGSSVVINTQFYLDNIGQMAVVGNYIYVPFSKTSSIAMFTNNGTNLEPMTPESVSANSPYAVVANNNFAYVTNHTQNTISWYSIVDSALQPSTESIATGQGPFGVVMASSTSESYVYVTNSGDGTISMFSINNSGDLLPLNPKTVRAGSRPQNIIWNANGGYIYATNTSNTISMYSINNGGTLQSLAIPTISVPEFNNASLVTMAMSPDGKYAYVLNRNGVEIGSEIIVYKVYH